VSDWIFGAIIIAAIAGVVIIISVGISTAHGQEPAIPRPCAVEFSRYPGYPEVRVDIAEGHGGMVYYATVDGITNENRGWPAFRTGDGMAFWADFDYGDAGHHFYEVEVSRLGNPALLCQSSGRLP